MTTIQDFEKAGVQIKKPGLEDWAFCQIWDEAMLMPPCDILYYLLGNLSGNASVHLTVDRINNDDGVICFDIDFRDLKGRITGITTLDFQYGFERKVDYVDLKNIVVDSQWSGQHVGKRFLKNLVHVVDTIGGRSIQLTAESSITARKTNIGAYVWVKYGFVPDQYWWADLQDALYQRLKKLTLDKGLGDTVSALIYRQEPRTIRQVADLPNIITTPQGDKMPLGKYLLTAQEAGECMGWCGRLDLENAEDMDVFQRYALSRVPLTVKENLFYAPKVR